MSSSAFDALVHSHQGQDQRNGNHLVGRTGFVQRREQAYGFGRSLHVNQELRQGDGRRRVQVSELRDVLVVERSRLGMAVLQNQRLRDLDGGLTSEVLV